MKKFDILLLDNYIEQGLLSKQKHPEYPLWIYNYTPECVFSQKWDDITMQCRGLILDHEGNVVAIPFRKFFNYNEPNAVIPEGIPMILKKMDGSLIIATVWEDKLIVATRGSFVSIQAIMAKDLLENKYKELKNKYKEITKLIMIYSGDTWLFELIGPSNQIVVSYPEDKLVLLACINNELGTELNLSTYRTFWNIVEEYPATWDNNTIQYLKSLNIPNEEGFVLKWNNNYRLKVKFDDYLALHRIVTRLSKKMVLEWIAEGKRSDELMKKVPEEFGEWIRDITKEAYSRYVEIFALCTNFVISSKYKETSRKEIALLTIKQFPMFQAIIFNIIDNKNKETVKNIWKIVKKEMLKEK
jgi:RNA ligase